jgi:four helix bundle protein
MRRAAISVTANIVEGYSRDSSADYARFLTISIASLMELEVFLELSFELKFIKKSSYENVLNLIIENKKLL